jgi:hypothetical protein
VDEPRVEATHYTVSLFPDASVNAAVWDVTVERRSAGRWAVCNMGRCLNADGKWDREPIPSSRDDEWKEQHRFDLDDALELAKQVAPTVAWNGMTAVQCVEWEAGRG